MTENEIEFLQQENERLKSEVHQLREKEQGIHAGYKKQLSDIRRDKALALLLVGLKTEFDDLAPGVKVSALTEITNTRLAADAAEITVDEAGQLQLRKKDGTNFFAEDHNLLTPKTYLERILTRDKVLKTDDKGQNNNSGNESGAHMRSGGQQSRNNGSGGNWKHKTLTGLVDESLKALAGAE